MTVINVQISLCLLPIFYLYKQLSIFKKIQSGRCIQDTLISQFNYKNQQQLFQMRASAPIKPLSLTFDTLFNSHNNFENLKVDSYQFLSRLGKGQFGFVYKCIDNRNNQFYAAKVINKNTLLSERDPKIKEVKLRLCKTQAQNMSICQSENLIKCYEIYQNEDLLVMILEYCNGQNLENIVIQKGKIPEDQAVLILKQIITGVIQMHSKQIYHRDLKPQNIMKHNGMYKIIDFGFSKKIVQMNKEAFATILGTMVTMAPQVIKREPYGLKVDIWSIGIIYYFMLMGKYPYKNADLKRVLEQITKGTFFLHLRGKISQNSIDFLQSILVVESKHRSDWAAIKEHVLLRNSSSKLPQNFQINREIQYKLFKSTDYIEKSHQFNSQNLQSQYASQMIQNTNLYPELKSVTKKVGLQQDYWDQSFSQQKRQKKQNKFINQNNVKKELESYIKNDENYELYEWTKEAYWQCKKTELLYNQILIPITLEQLQNLKDRNIVEMLYLIATRCLSNISSLNDKFQNKKQHYCVSNLETQIKPLYGRVMSFWETMAKKLTNIQNGTFNIVSDKFFSIFKRTEYQKKQNFFVGIQNANYKKQDQIYFTQQYINKYFDDISKKHKIYKQKKRYLKSFQKICLLKGKQFFYMDFQTHVQKMLRK